ncbi:MAG TPA: DJ-1/PfpI family protein [Pyrinomonadaceae bacterium]|nr:DJ-1/PfpI family protein [Pyrinomonadaceae bacterium]
MKRREFINQSACLGVVVATGSVPNMFAGNFLAPDASKLTPPSKGKIPVAFPISEGVTVIDFAGPWEVFQDVHVRDRGNDMDAQMPFQLYTVSDKTDVITGSGGLKLVPDYMFDTAPQPKVIVVPAQRGSQSLHAWLRKMSPAADVTMSVCTGAFQLGKAGLLSGKSATTHHDFFEEFEKAFPDVSLKRGLRFVENEKISTAGGLSSGIDLALRVVDRYFGRDVAQATATYMEYQSKGWIA